VFPESPQYLLYLVGGAFLLGWLTGKIGAWFGRRFQATDRDPRDDRIRSLDAELRIARSDLQRAKEAVEQKQQELIDAEKRAAGRQETIDELTRSLERVRRDLKDSVQKTRELRAELSDRATENLKSEVKLREVETELSVVQASSDLMATGVLDYNMNDEDDDEAPRFLSPGS